MEFHGPSTETPWKSMEFHGTPWSSMDPPWNSMEFHGPSMELHGVPWIIHGNPMELHGLPWNSMELRGVPWNSMDFHGVILHGEHLSSDKNSHIFKHLRGSANCGSLCSEDCFKILDSASTSFQLKIKEAMHILWEQPSLNSQVKHLNLSLSY